MFSLQFGLIVVFGIFYKKSQLPHKNRQLDVTVIVPFKNEQDRITPLLNSIDKLKIPNNVTAAFLFVDDHSEDETTELIKSTLHHKHHIIVNEGSGKKSAIRTAVNQSTSEYILTWDADIIVREDYFESLSKVPDADMVIFPVKMFGRNFLSRLAAIDFLWIQIVTYVLASWRQPVLNNGANLLFKKDAFIEADELRTDYDRLTGDDVYLLLKFKELNKEIVAVKHESLRVETKAPGTIKELKNQRKRWVSKFFDTMDARSAALSIILVIMIFGALGCIAYTLTYRELIFMLPFTMKIFNEYILMRIYNGKSDILLDIPLVIAHQIFFPIYMFYTLVNPIVEDTRWRD